LLLPVRRLLRLGVRLSLGGALVVRRGGGVLLLV